MKRNDFIKTLGLGALTISSKSYGLGNLTKANFKKLTILHTNDWHSRIEPFPKGKSRNSNKGGAARRSKLISDIRKREKNVLLFDAGDIFQVVLSQRLMVNTSADSFDIYRALRVVNPSPFMFHLKTPSCILVGASPEVMCRVEDGIITNRPLAGTRKRGRTEQEDLELEKELLADPKERAEHVMLVDLGRNDVGKVAKLGSVKLTEVMTIERYSHVMHISSNVQGELAENKTAFDALRATLPVGTVSGAPKVRAMEIIDEFEPTRRGPYAGAVGYLDFP